MSTQIETFDCEGCNRTNVPINELIRLPSNPDMCFHSKSCMLICIGQKITDARLRAESSIEEMNYQLKSNREMLIELGWRPDLVLDKIKIVYPLLCKLED